MKLNIELFGGRGASSSANLSWNRLTRQFPGKVVTDGINQVQLYGDANNMSDIERIWDMQTDRELDTKRKEAYNTTLEELNNAPIAFTTFGNEGRVFMNIYKNRNEMMNSIAKEYGGFKQMSGGSRYLISSLIGNGEFYLERDKYAKGGWKWLDGSGNYVEGIGKQMRNFRRK